ncbi:MAG: hypothetical protein H6667_06335 [Ardenticatenaceae bacterium]|nr:hypothetical protein [Ardenticatenaceae bacterium]MCB9442799.1 hypothetical protein [Ardenticatenaceae bacterium]
MPLVLIGGTIPALIILGRYFGLSHTMVIPVIVILSLVFGSVALWSYANRHIDGSEWWQDDSASGWRGD